MDMLQLPQSDMLLPSPPPQADNNNPTLTPANQAEMRFMTILPGKRLYFDYKIQE
jgi:hypothetical protein